MIEIIKGKKHFKPPQPGYELEGCNVKLIKKLEQNDKVFHPGWCLYYDDKDKKHLINEGIAEEYSHTVLVQKTSPILDDKGENIKKTVRKDQKDLESKHK